MTVSWPPDVPFCPQPNTHREGGPRGAVLRTPTDAGKGKSRRVTTAGPRSNQFKLPVLTGTQVTAFETWFDNAIASASGSLPFEAVHPRRQTLAIFAFVEDPAYEIVRVGPDAWEIEIMVEELPS